MLSIIALILDEMGDTILYLVLLVGELHTLQIGIVILQRTVMVETLSIFLDARVTPLELIQVVHYQVVIQLVD